MPFKNLADFIDKLKKEGEIKEIIHPVSPVLEISEITDRISKNEGPALLFTNTGTQFPLLINAMGSERRIKLALGVEHLDDISLEFQKLMNVLTGPKKTFWDKIQMLPRLKEISACMPKRYKGKAPCQQVVMETPDLDKLPILQCWPFDGGKFITLPSVHTIDPDNGTRNVGMYRMQVLGKAHTGMHWHRHKTGARHYEAYKKAGKKMPVSVTLGGDPVYTYAASAPMPDHFDEYLLAGFLRKKSVEMVKCLTNDIEVPADADFVLEGFIDPQEGLISEGPFGDHTGFYSLADFYPRFHITCITHRKEAIYPATIVGIPPMEDAWIGKATERIFLAPMRTAIALEILDMVMPSEGVFHNIVLVKIKKSYPGQGQKVMNALWGAGQMMFTKTILIFDENIDLNNPLKHLGNLLNKINPEQDLSIFQGPLDVLDHAGNKPSFGGKLGIDLTSKFIDEPGYTSSLSDNEIPALEDVQNKLRSFNDIIDFNYLINLGLPILLLSVHKNQKKQISSLFHELCKQPVLSGIKIICFMEDIVDIKDLKYVIWRAANNIDFKRDLLIFQPESPLQSIIGIDATRKTSELDNFQRPWPNITVMDQNTINSIDAKWEQLNIGPFIESPSNKFRKQCYPGEAIAE